ncbi:MAG: TonB-dependent receptor plug domain-containing protein [Prevotella sp.]|nr:TonB-dependent receptor plug domain-containing protein [Prevotella sp.]
MKYKLLLCGLLCAFCFRVSAITEAIDSIDKKVHSIEGVTVTSRKIPSRISSSKPIQVVEKEDLERLDITNLADAVKMFAGTNVKDYGGIGGMKTISIRNMGTQHTAVSYDGVTISNTQAGQIDLGRYSLDNVQTVELAIGESDDLLQTARHRASAGVLLINTEKPHFDYGHNYSFRVRVRGGAFGLINPTIRYWQKLTSTTTFSFNGDYMRADGIYPFTLVNGNQKTREKRYNSDIYTWRGEANLYQTIKDGELNLKAYWFYSQRGLPGSVILYNNTSKERLWDEDFFAQAHFKKRFSDRLALSACLKYVHSWNKYVDTNVKYQNGKEIDVNRQNECYASATVCWTPIQDLSFSLAEDIAYNDLRSNMNNAAQPNRYSSLTALSGKYVLGRLELQAGLVATLMTEDVKYGATPDDRKKLSPTASVAFRVLNTDALYIRALYKNTFRVPTFNDLYYDKMGTVSLNPEKANECNIGVTWQGKPFKFTKYVSITVDGYYDLVTDKIVAYPTLYVWKMANFGKVRMYGMNITFGSDMTLTKDISLLLNASYSLQNSIDLSDKTSLYYKTQIPYTPKNTGSGSVTLLTPWVNVGYSVMGCDKRYSMQQNTPEYRMHGYWEHNISLSHEFVMRSYRLNLQASIKNLTDEQYEIVKYYPMPGRSWTVTGTVTF